MGCSHCLLFLWITGGMPCPRCPGIRNGLERTYNARRGALEPVRCPTGDAPVTGRPWTVHHGIAPGSSLYVL